MGCNLCTQLDPNLPQYSSNIKKPRKSSKRNRNRRLSTDNLNDFSENNNNNPNDHYNYTSSSNEDSDDHLDEIHLSKLLL